jgi:acyl-CoA synthetase (AMP-forming)/AMP-acid ligase II
VTAASEGPPAAAAIDEASSVPGLLERAARLWPERLALTDATCQVDYAGLHQRVQQTAAVLLNLGVGPGERVCLVLGNEIDTVVIALATASIGAVFVVLGERYSARQLEEVLADASPALTVVGTGSAFSSPTGQRMSPTDLRGGEIVTPGPLKPGAVGEDSVVMLVYTSGSTGRPRGVVCPQAPVLFCIEAIGERLGYCRDDVIYVCLPLSFDYGFYQILLALAAGAHVVLRDVDRLGPALCADISKVAPTVLPVTPAIAAAMTRMALRRATSFPSVRLVTNTGGYLGDATRADIRRACPRAQLILMFGLTECKRVAIAEPDADLRDPATAGQPLRGVEVEVRSPEGVSLEPGQTGELWVRGPNLMAGYWRNPVESAKRFVTIEGRPALRTGDAVSLTPDGTLHFHGRLSDQIKVRGVRASAHEIERAALSLPGVRTARVVQDGAGATALFFEGEVSVDALRAWLLEDIGAWKIPDQLHARDALPRTANQKIDGRALLASLGWS